MSIITEGDKWFLHRQAIPYFHIPVIGIKYSRSKKRWPDIWINLNGVPIITITDEWKRQTATERRKRLVHEMLHAVGMQHDERIGYSTFPKKDSYSKMVYRHIVRVMGE